MERKATVISKEEMTKIKIEANRQQMLKNPLPEGPELIIGKKYQLASYNIIKIIGIDKENDKLHYFDFTQNCNVYPKLSTFRVKTTI
jgi:hypothetical protein